MTIFDVKFSSDGQMLAACDSESRLNVWRIANILVSMDYADNPLNPVECQPMFSAVADAGPLYSLAVAGSLVISGGDLQISVWDISRSSDDHRPIAILVNPRSATSGGALSAISETNGIAYSTQTGTLYSAAGDGNAYSWDLSTGQMIATFAGHAGYLHCIALDSSSPAILCTGSEDGTVRLWDTRTNECSSILDMQTGLEVSEATIAGERKFSFVSCLSIDGDSLVCGSGSRRISHWHLPSRKLIRTIEAGSIPEGFGFVDDKVISVGTDGAMTTWKPDGTAASQMKSLSGSLFTIDVNAQCDARLRLGLAGTGEFIEVLSGTTMPGAKLRM